MVPPFSLYYGGPFPLEPEICLLGKFTNVNLRNSVKIKFTEIALVTARKCIALTWKSDSPLPRWLSEMKKCITIFEDYLCF